jgi:energy-converting hydrogenase B subunit D
VIMEIVLIVLGIMILGGGIMVIVSKDIVGAIIASGVVSLLASIIYLIVGAPDVAMTEAAIGSGLTTVVFLFAWSRIKQLRDADAIPESDSDTAGGISVDPDLNQNRKLTENQEADNA